MTVDFFEGEGGANMHLHYSGPDTGGEEKVLLSAPLEQPEETAEGSEKADDGAEFFMVGEGSWDEVRDSCMMQGGDLASILSADEATKAALACPHLRCYIGLTRAKRGDPFFWTDGSPLDYAAWDEGQPQSSETVVVWTDGAGGSWHDWGQGSDRFPGVCKKSERTISKTCNTIIDCEECLRARDPNPDIASDCVPVEPTTNGNMCEPKRYIQDTKDTLNLEVAASCNLPSKMDDDPSFYTGSIPFPTSKSARKCIDAVFPYAFDGEASSVRDLVSIAQPMSELNAEHDPASLWVEDITTHGFTVCVQETTHGGLEGLPQDNDDMLVVDYMAYLSQPFPGARYGDVKLQNGFAGKACSELVFEPSFAAGAAPKIVASVNHRRVRDRHVVDSVWFEDVTATSAKVCVAVPVKSDPQDSSTQISYVAWDEVPQTIDEGEVSVDAFSWTDTREATTCKYVSFNKGWTYPPQIQIGLNHRGYERSDSHKPMTLWMEHVDKQGFRFCAQQLADTWDTTRSGQHDAFKVDWFATGFDGCPRGEVVRPGTIVKYYFLDKQLRAMPDLSGLTPNHVLTIDQIDDDKRADFEKMLPDFPTQDVAASWQGIVFISEPGMYSFYVSSDDGAAIHIDGVLVVENVGKRKPELTTGRIRLAAGVHSFKAEWYVGEEQQEKIKIQWQGAETGFKRVDFKGSHCASPTPMDPEVGLQPGFQAKWFYFDQALEVMPDVTVSNPDADSVSQSLDYEGIDSFRKDVPSIPEGNFAATFDGIFSVQVEGDYIFISKSDAGSHVYIDGVHVVNNGGLHRAEVKTGTIKLPRGYHFIKVAYFEQEGDQILQVSYSGPDTNGAEEGIEAYHFASVIPGANGKLFYFDQELEGFPKEVTDGSQAVSNVIQSKAIDFHNKQDFREVVPDFPGECFAGIWKGDFEIVKEGTYKFFLSSTDGSHLLVDGSELIDNAGRHSAKTERVLA